MIEMEPLSLQTSVPVFLNNSLICYYHPFQLPIVMKQATLKCVTSTAVMFTDSVRQELGQEIAGMACLCSTMFEASPGKTQKA